MKPGATFSSTLRFSTIASGGTRPWAISARSSSRSLSWRRELTTVSAKPGEDQFPASVVQRWGKGVEIRLECRLVFGRQGRLIHPLHMGATGRPHRLLHSTNSGENHPIGLVGQQD